MLYKFGLHNAQFILNRSFSNNIATITCWTEGYYGYLQNIHVKGRGEKHILFLNLLTLVLFHRKDCFLLQCMSFDVKYTVLCIIYSVYTRR